VEPAHTIELAQGTIRYRDSGRGQPLVFLHGLLVDGLLWRKVTPLLEGKFRCIVPDWPLGSHRVALTSGAERSPRGMAHLVGDFLESHGLEDVTIVANDTGGAIAQLLVTERPQRVGRLVLTPCDSHENFLPPMFRPLQWLARSPPLLQLAAQATRSARIRRSPLGFGMLVKRLIPDEITRRWMQPSLSNRDVREDVVALLRAIDSRDTLSAARKLHEFQRPTLIAWARHDPVFKQRFAERLLRDLPNARLEMIDDSRAFVPEDQPERLAELIDSFAQ
jgi:pimeloyl-ACP methyl ester carboxylesterase